MNSAMNVLRSPKVNMWIVNYCPVDIETLNFPNNNFFHYCFGRSVNANNG